MAKLYTYPIFEPYVDYFIYYRTYEKDDIRKLINDFLQKKQSSVLWCFQTFKSDRDLSGYTTGRNDCCLSIHKVSGQT
jgi:hypothetical protein